MLISSLASWILVIQLKYHLKDYWLTAKKSFFFVVVPTFNIPFFSITRTKVPKRLIVVV